MGEEETKGPTTNGRIQLLVHCVDGCFPYLNPTQLEQHFPPSKTDLWLGLAVRDACVVPVFQAPKVKQQTASESEPPPTTPVFNKVRGYTFVANRPDPWLLPYTRLTVPSFDLRATEDEGTKSNNNNVSKNTNTAIHVWTPHGRQKLTPDLYATAALDGLKSHHTVSLYDDVEGDEFSRKRKEKANLRNHTWFQHLESKHESSTSQEHEIGDADAASVVHGSLLWKAVLLPHEGETESSNKDHPQTTGAPRTTEQNKKGDNTARIKPDIIEHVPSGIALVGRWSPGIELSTILPMIRGSNAKYALKSVAWKALLTTYSLADFLDVASTGTVNVIGTNLPQKWAKEKLALGLDLAKVRGGSSEEGPLVAIETETGTSKEPDSKRQKRVEESMVLLNADGCMDMADTKHSRDATPLVAGCDCFVCKDTRFSRAYIHHLVVAKEMLAEIILFGHNLHSLLKVLQAFNDHPVSGTTVKELICRQLPPQ